MQVRLFEYLNELEPAPGAEIITGGATVIPAGIGAESLKDEGNPDERDSGTWFIAAAVVASTSHVGVRGAYSGPT